MPKTAYAYLATDCHNFKRAYSASKAKGCSHEYTCMPMHAHATLPFSKPCMICSSSTNQKAKVLSKLCLPVLNPIAIWFLKPTVHIGAVIVLHYQHIICDYCRGTSVSFPNSLVLLPVVLHSTNCTPASAPHACRSTAKTQPLICTSGSTTSSAPRRPAWLPPLQAR